MQLAPGTQSHVDRVIANRKARETHATVDGGCLQLQYSAELDVYVIRWTTVRDNELIACYDGDNGASATRDFQALVG